MKRVDLKKILYMDFLIRHKCTGTSKEFAAKMDMSRSTLFVAGYAGGIISAALDGERIADAVVNYLKK